MDTRTLSFWSIPLLAWTLAAGEPLFGDTVTATYSFIGSSQTLLLQTVISPLTELRPVP